HAARIEVAALVEHRAVCSGGEIGRAVAAADLVFLVVFRDRRLAAAAARELRIVAPPRRSAARSAPWRAVLAGPEPRVGVDVHRFVALPRDLVLLRDALSIPPACAARGDDAHEREPDERLVLRAALLRDDDLLERLLLLFDVAVQLRLLGERR